MGKAGVEEIRESTSPVAIVLGLVALALQLVVGYFVLGVRLGGTFVGCADARRGVGGCVDRRMAYMAFPPRRCRCGTRRHRSHLARRHLRRRPVSRVDRLVGEGEEGAREGSLQRFPPPAPRRGTERKRGPAAFRLRLASYPHPCRRTSGLPRARRRPRWTTCGGALSPPLPPQPGRRGQPLRTSRAVRRAVRRGLICG